MAEKTNTKEDINSDPGSLVGRELITEDWVFRLIVICVVVIQFILVSVYVYRLAYFETDSAEVTGYATDTKQVGTSTVTYFYPVYSYSFDDTLYTATATNGRGSPRYAVHEQVDVLVNPKNPSEFQIKSWNDVFFNVLLTLIFGIILIVIYVMHPLVIVKKVLYKIFSIFINKP